MKFVTVYCASSSNIRECYFEAARQVGRGLAEHGLGLVNGAGIRGLMGAVSDACLEAGGKVTGVIPQFMIERGWQHTGLTQLIVTKDMHERKKTMVELSSAVIVLPGGCGTFDEMFEMLSWKQLGLCQHKLILLNVEGYFDPMLQMLQKAIDEDFMRSEYTGLWQVANTADEALALLEQL